MEEYLIKLADAPVLCICKLGYGDVDFICKCESGVFVPIPTDPSNEAETPKMLPLELISPLAVMWDRVFIAPLAVKAPVISTLSTISISPAEPLA